jgi:hypothetical protein
MVSSGRHTSILVPFTTSGPGVGGSVTREASRHSTSQRRLALVVVGSISLLGCGVELPEPSAAMPVRASCPVVTAEDYYFVPGSFASEQKEDRRVRHAFSDRLRAAHLTSLSCGDVVREAYRLMYTTASGSALIIEIQDESGPWHLRIADVPSAASDGGDHYTVSGARLLSRPEVESLRQAVYEVGFWALRTTEAPDAMDGSCLLVEGTVKGIFHAVSCPPAKKVERLADVFVQLARIPRPWPRREGGPTWNVPSGL